MQTRFLTIACMAALALAAAGCGGSTTHQASLYADVGATQIRETRSYIIVLNIVPPEHMYQPAVAAKLHPTEGEFILQGLMGPIHADSRHFEAHVYSQKTGKPMYGRKVTVEVVDHTSNKTYPIKMTQMQDVVVGPPDFHYGNNADLPAGDSYSITVRVNGETTVFNLKLV
jgi:hypothetical protein